MSYAIGGTSIGGNVSVHGGLWYNKEEEERQKTNKQIEELCKIVNKQSEQINCTIKRLDDLETHIKYMPGGSGYIEAKQEWEENTDDFCGSCRCTLPSKAAKKCVGCHNMFCESCMKKCNYHYCSEYFCPGCIYQCHVCDKRYCDNCKSDNLSQCNGCLENVCNNCVYAICSMRNCENIVCNTCIKDKTVIAVSHCNKCTCLYHICYTCQQDDKNICRGCS